MNHTGNEKITRTRKKNIQGGNSKIKKTSIVADMETYKTTAIATTETKISAQSNRVQTLRTAEGKVSYSHYLSGSKHTKQGVGLIVRSDTKCSFLPVNYRLCKVIIKIENVQIVIISAYAPTLEIRKKHPQKCEQFYDELQSLIKTVKTRDLLIVTGDFNAKTWSKSSRRICSTHFPQKV